MSNMPLIIVKKKGKKKVLFKVDSYRVLKYIKIIVKTNKNPKKNYKIRQG